MSNRDRILEYVRRFPGRDDDEIARALNILPRQTVNQVCRALVVEGALERYRGARGKIVNAGTVSGDGAIPNSNLGSDSAPVSEGAVAPPEATKDWYWEGNICQTLANWFEARGWLVMSQADTLSRARGFDLHVRKASDELIIEAKGYPPSMYRDPARRSERKRTNPSVQAQHWYGQALLQALRLQNEHPDALVAMAFPDFPRYRNLFDETRPALTRLQLEVLFVGSDGAVDVPSRNRRL